MTTNVAVTGWDQGLGLNLSTRFIRDGCRVARIPALRVEALRDSTTIHDIYGIVAEVYAELEEQRVDVWVNNFAINGLSWIGDTSLEEMLSIMHCNVILPYAFVDALVTIQITDPVKVINIASQTYRVSQRCTTLYGASKAALVAMTKTMARELAEKGWTVNAVAPGRIEGTDMTKLTDAQVMELRGWSVDYMYKYALRQVPMNRFTTTAEVTEAVMKLLDMPPYVNGIVLDVMGGV